MRKTYKKVFSIILLITLLFNIFAINSNALYKGTYKTTLYIKGTYACYAIGAKIKISDNGEVKSFKISSFDMPEFYPSAIMRYHTAFDKVIFFDPYWRADIISDTLFIKEIGGYAHNGGGIRKLTLENKRGIVITPEFLIGHYGDIVDLDLNVIKRYHGGGSMKF